MIRYPYLPYTSMHAPLIREDLVRLDSVPRPPEREIVYRDAECGPLVFRTKTWDQQLFWCRQSLMTALMQLDEALGMRGRPWPR